MDPTELKILKDRSLEIFIARQNKSKELLKKRVFIIARSSIVADIELPPNHLIKESDIWARRPGFSQIPGSDFDLVLGRRTNKNQKESTDQVGRFNINNG